MPLGNSKTGKQQSAPLKSMTYDAFKLSQLTETTRRHMLMSIQGATSSRKSSFALSAPGAIAVFDHDNGLEYVVDRYSGDKEIFQVTNDDGENPLAVTPESDEIKKQAQADRIWGKVKTTYYEALANPDIKTIVVDTGSHLWEIAQWSEMGRIAIENADKENPVLPFHYGEVNQQFRSLFQQAIRSKKHVIFTHREKEEWSSKGGTGKMILHGWKHTLYEVEVALVSSMFGTGSAAVPNIRVAKCRINQGMEGHTFSGEKECNFAHIAGKITGTDEKDWR